MQKLLNPAGELNLTLTPDLMQHVGKEVFLYSCVIDKYNPYGWRNRRTLLMTQQSIMLLNNKNKDLRRKVEIAKVEAVTVSLHPSSFEMVVHIKQEPDIRIISQSFRKQLVDTLKMFYATLTKKNLPIYGVR